MTSPPASNDAIANLAETLSDAADRIVKALQEVTEAIGELTERLPAPSPQPVQPSALDLASNPISEPKAAGGGSTVITVPADPLAQPRTSRLAPVRLPRAPAPANEDVTDEYRDGGTY